MEMVKSKIKRKEYIKPAWIYFLLAVLVIPMIIFIIVWNVPTTENLSKTIQNIVIFISVGAFTMEIPNLCIFGGYLGFCYGITGTSKITLFDDVMVYSKYSGSMGNRETITYYIKKTDSVVLTKRTMKIKGGFEKKITGGTTNSEIKKRAKVVNIPRVFEDEEKILAFLKK
ncbi:MAG: hypothetical protein ACERKV_05830 [Clostridiaceae bacterium]